jgi:hypothetical protein
MLGLRVADRRQLTAGQTGKGANVIDAPVARTDNSDGLSDTAGQGSLAIPIEGGGSPDFVSVLIQRAGAQSHGKSHGRSQQQSRSAPRRGRDEPAWPAPLSTPLPTAGRLPGFVAKLRKTRLQVQRQRVIDLAVDLSCREVSLSAHRVARSESRSGDRRGLGATRAGPAAVRPAALDSAPHCAAAAPASRPDAAA